MAHVPLVHLPWDSDFFGVSIARASLSETPLARTIAEARASKVSCVYLFAEGRDVHQITEAAHAGASLVALRTELAGSIDSPGCALHARRATQADLPDLVRMAEDLARASRFRADRRFDAAAIDEMYRIWLSSCLDDGVVVVPQEGLTGFVGAQIQSGEAHIELVYVSDEARGAKLASRLVAAATSCLGISRARVATQAGNVAAQRTYQSLGLKTEAVEAILHLWLDES
jgi:ribosomal protein S18 acetylase RimI-like enzyme